MPRETSLSWFELGLPELGFACMEAARLASRDVVVTIEDHALIKDSARQRLSIVKYVGFLRETGQAGALAETEVGWAELRRLASDRLAAGEVLVKLTTPYSEDGVEVLEQVTRQGRAMMQTFIVPDSMPPLEG